MSCWDGGRRIYSMNINMIDMYSENCYFFWKLYPCVLTRYYYIFEGAGAGDLLARLNHIANEKAEKNKIPKSTDVAGKVVYCCDPTPKDLDLTPLVGEGVGGGVITRKLAFDINS